MNGDGDDEWWWDDDDAIRYSTIFAKISYC